MCAAFVNNYSSDFAEERQNQRRLAMEPSKPLGFENDEQFSKALSSLLRHRALHAKIQVHPGGYVDTADILKHFGRRCTEEDIERVVMQDKKHRYHLRRDAGTGRSFVRANQGHTIPIEDDGTLLEEITREPDLSAVTHGTTSSAWLTIKHEGLRRMKRNHIHFIPGRAKPTDAMLPGYRNTSSILIFVDIRRAILDGIQFFRSKNNVILSPGNDKGCIPIEYFEQVVDSGTNEVLWPLGSDTSSMRQVTPESPVRFLIVGATMSDWKRARKDGISRKQKDFIRLTRPSAVEKPGEDQPRVRISVDAQKAMGLGIVFYYLDEKNDVIVTKGNDKGVIPIKCCDSAIDTSSNTTLWQSSK